MKYIYLITILAIISALSSPFTCQAVPAAPYPFTVTQPDGSTITIKVHGDEFFHYTTTDDGYNITQGADRMYYYADLSQRGTFVASKIRANDASKRSSIERMALSTRSKGIPAYIKANMSKLSRMQRISTRSTRASFERASAIPATMKALVILAAFKDVPFSNESAYSDFDNLLNQLGYSANGAIGSARDYFTDNSNGKFTPQFEVIGPVNLPQNMAYYGANAPDGNDIRPREMTIDACKLAKSQFNINFANYDTNGDGDVDNVFIVFAGLGESYGGEANTIWPHEWSIARGMEGSIIDGKQLAIYACASELTPKGTGVGTKMTAIGTFCHEFGHILGLPDTYDTDYESNGQSIGLSKLSLMSSGNYNNDGITPAALTSMERWMSGWLTPTTLEAQTTGTLKPIKNNEAFIIYTKNKNEFFLLENRVRSDFKWDASIDGDGMIVYHVDMSLNIVAGELTAAQAWTNNRPNNYSDHECMRLVRAVTSTTTSSRYFYPGSSNITSLLSKGSYLWPWSGEKMNIELQNIRLNSDKTITFDVIQPNQLTTIAINRNYNSDQPVILSATTPEKPKNIVWYVDNTLENRPSPLLSKGMHQIKAVVTHANNEKEIIIRYVTIK